MFHQHMKRRYVVGVVLLITVGLITNMNGSNTSVAGAFAIHHNHQPVVTTASSTTSWRRQQQQQQQQSQQLQQKNRGSSSSIVVSDTRLRAGGGDGGIDDDDDDGANNAKNMMELTSTLAKLDQQWKIQQQSKKTKSRWSKLILPKDPTEEVTEEQPGDIDDDDYDTEASRSNNSIESKEDYVWILEPPQSIPSCVIVFTGGAGLGQFPHIAYNELLSRISNKLNAVCLVAPYSVGLDHFGLAKQTGELARRALIYCEDDPSRQYPPTIPTYALAHSLGCKLQTIYMAATQQQFDGIGFMAFNNFSFSQTISMAKMFADQIRKSTSSGGFDGGMGSGFGSMGSMFSQNSELFDQVFSFAENIIGAIGVDFSPNAQDTERLIEMRFDDILQSKTRLFVFDEDNLDNSKEFVDRCTCGPGPSTSGLPGGHLSPVFFKFGLDDIDSTDIPPEAFDMAQEAMGGFRGASFGDEDALESLVNEICDWILGKPPTREPHWESAARNEPPKLIGYDPSTTTEK